MTSQPLWQQVPVQLRRNLLHALRAFLVGKALAQVHAAVLVRQVCHSGEDCRWKTREDFVQRLVRNRLFDLIG